MAAQQPIGAFSIDDPLLAGSAWNKTADDEWTNLHHRTITASDDEMVGRYIARIEPA